jgi:DNA-binding MarR family transcriptional regulator
VGIAISLLLTTITRSHIVVNSNVVYANEIKMDDKNGQLLRDVARLHAQLQRDSVSCCGTTQAQCHILTELGRGGPLPMAELVRRLSLDKGWISRTVDSLLAEGLLSKTPSDTDHRMIVVGLTEAGQQRCHELNDSLNGLSERVMQRIPENERGNVQQVLNLLYHALLAENTPVTAMINLEDIR